MKFSICIPHYNRIAYLKQSLSIIEEQVYRDFEVCISDDNSTDNSYQEITEFAAHSSLKINYQRNTFNEGYDRNLRKSIEMAKGDYCLILGNDDTLAEPSTLQKLANILAKLNFPLVLLPMEITYFQ